MKQLKRFKKADVEVFPKMVSEGIYSFFKIIPKDDKIKKNPI